MCILVLGTAYVTLNVLLYFCTLQLSRLV